MSMLDLNGRTALVTGASQGIGEAIARRLAIQGARVVVAARNVERLKKLADEIDSIGSSAHVLPLDLADSAAIADRLAELPPPFVEIDVLINNAGITADNIFARMKLEQWEEVLQVNLTGAFAVTRALCRGMMRRRWGRIVSVSSVVGLMGNAGQANYAAAKAGMHGFTMSLAPEGARKGVTVNTISPGYISTAMTQAIPEEVLAKIVAGIPMRKMGETEDIASMIGFLASPAAGYFTGANNPVNGGQIFSF